MKTSLFALCLLIFYFGCANFSSIKQSKTEFASSDFAIKAEILYFKDAKEVHRDTWIYRKLKDNVDSALKFVKSMETSRNSKNVILYISKNETPVSPWLCGLTFGLWPAKEIDIYEVTGILRDNDGNEIRRVHAQQKQVIWYQIFLILAMPFKPPLDYEEEIIESLIHDSLKKLSQSSKV